MEFRLATSPYRFDQSVRCEYHTCRRAQVEWVRHASVKIVEQDVIVDRLAAVRISNERFWQVKADRTQ